MNSCPEVDLKQGRVVGRCNWTLSGSKYFYFKGIPYAKPPVGELRFLAPEPPEPWSGTRDCSFERSTCPQPYYAVPNRLYCSTDVDKTMRNNHNTLALAAVIAQPHSLAELAGVVRCVPAFLRFLLKIFNQSEDCLYLNVFTPQIPSCNVDSPDLPVIVWIHGGGFLIGDGDEDTNGLDLFLDRGAVVVTFNYRLGPFGFLSLDTKDAPGNAGMKDQVAALRWVRDNIIAFGGNSDCVTLFGTSAGGASAHLHTLSPMSRGLFHRVIACSGVALCDWVVTRDHLNRAKGFAEALGVEADSPEAVVAALRALPARKLCKAMLKYVIFYNVRCLNTSIQFVPTVEHISEGAFLSEDPEQIIREGRQTPVPIIAGLNNREGIAWFLGLENMNLGLRKLYVLSDQLREVSKMPDRLIPPELSNVLSEEERNQVGKQILEFYCGERGLCMETADCFVELVADMSFTLKFLRAAQLLSTPGSPPVYLYQLAFDGKLGAIKYLLEDFEYQGVGHGDELSYILHMKILPPSFMIEANEPQREMRQKFTGALFNFIKTGDPNPRNQGKTPDTRWKPTSSETLEYLQFDSKNVMKYDKFGDRYQFWDNLYKKYLNKPLFEY